MNRKPTWRSRVWWLAKFAWYDVTWKPPIDFYIKTLDCPKTKPDRFKHLYKICACLDSSFAPYVIFFVRPLAVDVYCIVHPGIAVISWLRITQPRTKSQEYSMLPLYSINQRPQICIALGWMILKQEQHITSCNSLNSAFPSLLCDISYTWRAPVFLGWFPSATKRALDGTHLQSNNVKFTDFCAWSIICGLSIFGVLCEYLILKSEM